MGFFSSLISQIPRVGASFIKAPLPPDAGIYHFLIEDGAEKTRAHLRVEQDGSGMLLVNANRSFHLNPTATHLAFLYLSKEQDARVIESITHSYHVSKDQARQDYGQIVNQLQELLRPDGACPICDLELETIAPFSVMPSAPYRMDLAITYRCNNDCAHCYNDRERHAPELDTAHWKQVLDRLWNAGIPHIVFTGGEPTLRPDLPELVAHAEKNGQITGINTNGRLLKDVVFLQKLVDAGLEHAQITLESHLPEIHNRMVARSGAWDDTIAGIENALATRLFVMTNTTLLEENSVYLAGTLDFLAELGVPTIGLNALIYSGRGLTVGTGLTEESLPPLLDLARQSTQAHGQRLIWYTPTEYCHFDPVQMQLGVKGCTAARYNMCVEPDGSVIPCQSYYQSIGNLLSNSWESIWNHDLAISLREHKNLPQVCVSCALLSECGGGCPLARQAAHSISTLSVSFT
ncbi:MAG TPA: radical SAM protein [Anaerolineaceae bacterium]|nr:radical SAM protein [Anaerolineaceae bacterium]